jgi:hypothetical protein
VEAEVQFNRVALKEPLEANTELKVDGAVIKLNLELMV